MQFIVGANTPKVWEAFLPKVEVRWYTDDRPARVDFYWRWVPQVCRERAVGPPPPFFLKAKSKTLSLGELWEKEGFYLARLPKIVNIPTFCAALEGRAFLF